MTTDTRPFIIGTAGHVDHGKTTLVRFLTGVNTDRLREEQARGITIELGFAPFTLGQGTSAIKAGLVDVPGHERFVRHMVSGAGGMDLVMMVVAADEGVMPQTREHLDICRLLGVAAGVVVLTKVDLVEEEWIELVEEDVREGLQGTFLQDAPMVRFTAKPDDPEAQRRAIEEAVGKARGAVRRDGRDALLRLPVDRAFSMRGHGTVVTGTVVGGSLAVGEEVELQPGGLRSRVRNLQSFGASRETVIAGMRAAVNLPQAETAQVSRGMVLVRPGTVRPTDTLDVLVSVLPHAPHMLEDQSAAIFHAGAAHTNATLRVFGAPILPGERGLARLHLQEPVVVLPGDHFILRGYADVPGHGKTVGGGRVLLLSGGPYRLRYKGARLQEFLDALVSAEGPERLQLVLAAAGHEGLPLGDLAARLGLGLEATAGLLADGERAQGTVMPVEESPRLYLATEIVTRLGERIEGMVADHVAANPSRTVSCAKPSARASGRRSDRARSLPCSIGWRPRHGGLARDVVSLPGHEARLEGAHAETPPMRPSKAVRAGALAPPRVEQLAEETGRQLARCARHRGAAHAPRRLVRVADGLYYEPAQLDAVRDQLQAYLRTTVRSRPSSGRTDGAEPRHLIPLAEYFRRRQAHGAQGRSAHAAWRRRGRGMRRIVSLRVFGVVVLLVSLVGCDGDLGAREWIPGDTASADTAEGPADVVATETGAPVEPAVLGGVLVWEAGIAHPLGVMRRANASAGFGRGADVGVGSALGCVSVPMGGGAADAPAESLDAGAITISGGRTEVVYTKAPKGRCSHTRTPVGFDHEEHEGHEGWKWHQALRSLTPSCSSCPSW
jgi:selenocysteine-specific elongation factor